MHSYVNSPELYESLKIFVNYIQNFNGDEFNNNVSKGKIILFTFDTKRIEI